MHTCTIVLFITRERFTTDLYYFAPHCPGEALQLKLARHNSCPVFFPSHLYILFPQRV